MIHVRVILSINFLNECLAILHKHRRHYCWLLVSIALNRVELDTIEVLALLSLLYKRLWSLVIDCGLQLNYVFNHVPVLLLLTILN